MKKSVILIKALILSLSLNCFAGNFPEGDKKELNNPVFVFNNAFNKGGTDPISYDEQASILKRLGFDGIEHRETEGILEMKEALEKKGLKLYADYMQIDIDSEEPYLPEWKEVIPKLEGTGIILWVHIHSKKYKSSDEAADDQVVAVLQELADLGAPYGVRIAIYPHTGFLAEKAEDSYRLAVKAGRDNVGSVFNLCHFLKTDSEENMIEVIDLTFPKLFAVSINGADRGNTREMGWDRLIQPLGEGSFDVYRLVELLAEKGYKGPFGIQCYNIPGDPVDILKKSSKTLREYRKKYSRSVNVQTKQKKL
jgi:sugar phosphate isomerase/epimerase